MAVSSLSMVVGWAASRETDKLTLSDINRHRAKLPVQVRLLPELHYH